MDIKDIKKEIGDAEEIKIKKIKTKGKDINLEEINIKRKEKSKNLLSTLKKSWKKINFLLWKDDSFKGWVVSILVLFIFIKFIFFPLLSLITGTSLPLAIVESCSMYHEGIISNYDSWWEQHELKYTEYGLTKENFFNFVFRNGFNKGDILFIVKAEPEKLEIGDVIIFDAGKQIPIIHRIISIENLDGKYIFSTIGDNNNGQLEIEKEINEDQLMGKAIFKIIPYAGWGKLVFFESMRQPSERGFCEQN